MGRYFISVHIYCCHRPGECYMSGECCLFFGCSEQDGCDSGLKFLSFWHAGIDFATRKIASMLKPQKVIKQDGDCFTIRTLTSFKNYECSFKIGEEYKEVTKGMDNRLCQVDLIVKCNIIVVIKAVFIQIHASTCFLCYHKQFSCVVCCIWHRFCHFHQTVVNWENDKLVCVQKGEKKNRGWTHWIQGDELHLVWLQCLFWWPQCCAHF